MSDKEQVRKYRGYNPVLVQDNDGNPWLCYCKITEKGKQIIADNILENNSKKVSPVVEEISSLSVVPFHNELLLVWNQN